jgi:hypothetical protein
MIKSLPFERKNVNVGICKKCPNVVINPDGSREMSCMICKEYICESCLSPDEKILTEALKVSYCDVCATKAKLNMHFFANE